MTTMRSSKSLILATATASALSTSGSLRIQDGPESRLPESVTGGKLPTWRGLSDEPTIVDRRLGDISFGQRPAPSAAIPAMPLASWGKVHTADRLLYAVGFIGYLAMASAFVLQFLG